VFTYAEWNLNIVQHYSGGGKGKGKKGKGKSNLQLCVVTRKGRGQMADGRR